jgi:hypothetical protein
MLPCDSQDEKDLIRYLFYTLNSLGEFEDLSSEVLQTISDSNIDEDYNSVNYSFYNFTFTDEFFTTYKKSESVNWRIEGF